LFPCIGYTNEFAMVISNCGISVFKISDRWLITSLVYVVRVT